MTDNERSALACVWRICPIMRRMQRPTCFSPAHRNTTRTTGTGAGRIVGQSQRYGANARRPPPGRGAVPKSSNPRRTLSFHAPSFGIGIFTGALVVVLFGYLPELLAPAPPLATTGEPRAGSAADGTAATSKDGQVEYVFHQLLKMPAPQVTTPSRADLTAADALAADAAPMSTLQPGMVVGGDAPPSVLSPSAAGEAAEVPPVAPPPDLATMQQDVESDRPPEAVPVSGANAEPHARVGLLQAASFPERTDAERLRAELIMLGLPASTGEIQVGGQSWYRVTVGPFPDVAAAEGARERLRERNLTAIDVRR